MDYYQSSFSKFLKPSFFNYSFIEIFLSILLSIFLIFFSFNYQDKSSNLRLILIDYLKPFSSIFTYPINKVSDVLEKIDYLVELDANSLELKKKVHKYEDELNKLYHLKVENIELKRLLNLKSPPSDYTISGRIIIDPKNFITQNIYIDVGSDDNVKVNNPVLNENGLIGRIVKVNKDASEVLLITDSKSNLPVISMDTNLKFFLNGSLNGFVIKHLENPEKLINNELILSTSSSGYFKEGIKVGKVFKDGNKVFVKPLAKKNDSKYIKVLVYRFKRDQPNFNENEY